MTWAGSQLTKVLQCTPCIDHACMHASQEVATPGGAYAQPKAVACMQAARAAGAVLLAPFVDRGLSSVQQALRLKSKRGAFLFVLVSCLSLAAGIFSSIVVMHAAHAGIGQLRLCHQGRNVLRDVAPARQKIRRNDRRLAACGCALRYRCAYAGLCQLHVGYLYAAVLAAAPAV